jgi:hypothetical protein
MSTRKGKRKSIKTRSSEATNKNKSLTEVYIVLRHEESQFGDDTIIQGVFRSSLSAADAVRQNVINEWSKDFFDVYEETVDEMDFPCVNVECPEGEHMNVYMVKHRVKP